jgi:hypothetical protein
MQQFLYPVLPAPRTAVLQPWFRKALLSHSSIRIFAAGWSREVEQFAPAAIAGTLEQLRALAPMATLTHALIVLARPTAPRVSDKDREALWATHRVPLFEQVIGETGDLLAAECEAHDGLHLDSPAMPLAGEHVELSPCPCGRKSPRIAVPRRRALALAATL